MKNKVSFLKSESLIVNIKKDGIVIKHKENHFVSISSYLIFLSLFGFCIYILFTDSRLLIGIISVLGVCMLSRIFYLTISLNNHLELNIIKRELLISHNIDFLNQLFQTSILFADILDVFHIHSTSLSGRGRPVDIVGVKLINGSKRNILYIESAYAKRSAAILKEIFSE